MKTGRNKEAWLNEYQGFKKYLNQCVVCQEIGYDPVKIEKKEGLSFKAKAMEYFYPLQVNDIGICSACERRLSASNRSSQV
jgi:disulfide oxidoreductase YuzD